MTLSEAIRLGSMLRPQAFGAFRGAVDGPRLPGDVLGLRFALGSCALGAAYDAGFLRAVETADVHDAEVCCPVCGQMTYGSTCVNHIVMHLNDEHRCTREQIADWVESIERATSPATAPSHEADSAEIQPLSVL